VGSHGALECLEGLIADLKKDYRDVIVAGKFEIHEKKMGEGEEPQPAF
jgi:hypothetical protein